MHRTTPANNAFRSYTAGGSRVTIEEATDKHTMQEIKGGMMKAENRKEVEHPQNYGFTSVVADAEKGKDGEVTGSAEGFMSYMGGSRSFPVMGIMDDRRHRLKGLDKGDVAMYRGREDGQQLHFKEDGTFLSVREDKTYRQALVPKKEEKEEQQGGGGGGGGQQAGGQGGGKKQPKGQDSRYDDNKKSGTYTDMQKEHIRNGVKDGSMTIKADKNTQFEAGQHIRKGETHRDSQMFVNGNVHAADHIAGGGTSISSGGGARSLGAAASPEGGGCDQPSHWSASGIPGTTSLLRTAQKVGTMGGMMKMLSGMMGMIQGQMSGGQTPAQRQEMEQRLQEFSDTLDQLDQQG